ncbi:hypothetical protein [Campylobacter sp.]|uniref:hypothetical protein n=1 Tax=Campylobacter sp. TaxID=205 RepID=UPI003612595B
MSIRGPCRMVLLDFEYVIVYQLCLRQKHPADKFANLTHPDPHYENAKFDLVKFDAKL